MDLCMHKEVYENKNMPAGKTSELSDWLTVSGDLDDFIYYGSTEKIHSER